MSAALGSGWDPRYDNGLNPTAPAGLVATVPIDDELGPEGWYALPGGVVQIAVVLLDGTFVRARVDAYTAGHLAEHLAHTAEHARTQWDDLDARLAGGDPA